MRIVLLAMTNNMFNPFESKNSVTKEDVLPENDFMIVPLQEQNWHDSVEQEGQLAVDVLETPQEIVVVATLAGTKPENVSLHLHKDLLTIRGERQLPVPEATNYFYQECFWGRFSRTVVLPVDVKEDSARAEYRNGILVIRFSKSLASGSIPLLIVEE